MQIEDGIEYHSLYEYLGYAAGKKLGNKVNKAAKKTKQKYVTQEVSNPVYEGEVFCYTKKFLDEYFEIKNKYEDLPF